MVSLLRWDDTQQRPKRATADIFFSVERRPLFAYPFRRHEIIRSGNSMRFPSRPKLGSCEHERQGKAYRNRNGKSQWDQEEIHPHDNRVDGEG